MSTHHKPYYASSECLQFCKDLDGELYQQPYNIYAYNPFIILLIIKRHMYINPVEDDIPDVEVVCHFSIYNYNYRIHTTQYSDLPSWQKYEECCMEAAGKVFVALQSLVYGNENRAIYSNESLKDYEDQIQTIKENKKLLGRVLLQHCPLSLNSDLAENLIRFLETDSIKSPTFPGLNIIDYNPRIIIEEKRRVQPKWYISELNRNNFEISHPSWRNYVVQFRKANSTSDLPSYSKLSTKEMMKSPNHIQERSYTPPGIKSSNLMEKTTPNINTSSVIEINSFVSTTAVGGSKNIPLLIPTVHKYTPTPKDTKLPLSKFVRR